MTEVLGQSFVADFYNNEETKSKVCFIALGGSEGGKPYYIAEPLFNRGFPVLSLAYFKEANLPDKLEIIPLEYFNEPIKWLKNEQGFEKIILIGISKGAELALLLASVNNEINGVVAYSPSSVVFEGFSSEQTSSTSSWTLNKVDIPFLPYDLTDITDMNDYYSIYVNSLKHLDLVNLATIKVEKINGSVLLLSGTDDKMWPSSKMGESIIKRLKEHKHPFFYKHIQFDGAGHVFSEYFTQFGGSERENKNARIESMEEIKKFYELF